MRSQGGSQCGHVLALAFDLLTAEQATRAAAHLVGKF